MTVSPSFAIHTFGCKLNQAESDDLARRLLTGGWRSTPEAEADVLVVNTCAVTAEAERKARQFIRSVHRQSSDRQVLVAGCYARRASAEVARLPGVALFDSSSAGLTVVEGHAAKLSAPPLGAAGAVSRLRTRALVKIQEGCRDACTYCVVPQVRGRPRSVAAEQVVAEVQRRVAEGHREVVLTGTQPGDYDGAGARLPDLVRRVLEETSVERLRLSSLQPQHLSRELLALWRDPRLCPQVHLPLQSGSDDVLARMGRRYDRAAFHEGVERLRAASPDMAVTTDVLVGFPGEGDADFAATYDFCAEVGFSRLHVFPFSPRPGTRAAKMGDRVPQKEVRRRAEAMRELARESARRFAVRFLGRRVEPLWERAEGESGARVWTGVVPNYLRVATASPQPLENRVVAGWGEAVDGDVLWVRLEEANNLRSPA